MKMSKTAAVIGGLVDAGKALGLSMAILIGAGGLSAAYAQSQFSPAITVDGMVITKYELDQRTAFLTTLRAPGDVRTLARDQLINEAIEMREAEKAGITPSADDIQTGMEDFVARGGLSVEKFLQLIAQNGVAEQSFRDFVTAGVTWRDYVRATFGPQAKVSRTEVRQAMAESVTPAGLRVLLSEIVLPAGDPATRKASMARAERLTGLDEDEFTYAASRFSTASSRNNGGAMNWTDVKALPGNVAAAVSGLQPGQTSRVLAGADDIRIYFMRDREQVSGAKPQTVVEYAALLLPGGQSDSNRAEAARIRKRALQCDDLYPIARGLPPEQLVRETLPEALLPATYASELARLDPGEISSNATTASGAMAIVMLCARGNELPRSVTEDQIAKSVQNNRIGTMAQAFLDRQRANARIEYLN